MVKIAKILEGNAVAAKLKAKQQAAVADLSAKGIAPTLAIIRVGEREDDLAYQRGTVNRCKGVGVDVRLMPLPGDVGQDALMELIDKINNDRSIHGALILQPLPEHIDGDAVRNALSPEKDIDGTGDHSLGGVFTGKEKGFAPCCATACMEILDHYGYEVTGKRVTVIGCSLRAGRPVAMLLLERNATVTICHTYTTGIPEICRESDIVIVSAGQAGLLDESCFSPGQVIIDVGINADDNGRLCGDVDFEAALSAVEAVTPVPGGVGTVTVSQLVNNVIIASRRMTGG